MLGPICSKMQSAVLRPFFRLKDIIYLIGLSPELNFLKLKIALKKYNDQNVKFFSQMKRLKRKRPGKKQSLKAIDFSVF
jgi:hypothetical protein